MIKLTFKEAIGMLAVFASIYTFMPIEGANTIWARFLVFVSVVCISLGSVASWEIFLEIVEDWRRKHE